MIQFNSISIQNFLSIGATTVDFDLAQHKNTIIFGENGSGKSTIVDAICYVLFNKTIRKVKLSQLISATNKKKLLIEVKFKINGSDYIVQRGQKPAIFSIVKDGIKFNSDAANADLQTKLELILGTDFKTFTQTCVMSTTSNKPFMELSTPERREVIEKMLDLEIIGSMGSVLKERSKETKLLFEMNSTQLEIKSTEIKAKSELIDSIGEINTSQIESLEQQIKLDDSNLVSLSEQKSKLEGLRLIYPDPPVLPTQPSKVEVVLPHRPEILTSPELPTQPSEPILELLIAPEETDHDLFPVLNTKISNLNSEMSVLVSKANEQKDIAKFYQHNENCDRCKQTISDDFKNAIIQDINHKINLLSKEYTAHNVQKDKITIELEYISTIKACYDSYMIQKANNERNHATTVNEIKYKHKAECDQIIANYNNKNKLIVSEWENECTQLTHKNNEVNRKNLEQYNQDVLVLMSPYTEQKNKIDSGHNNKLAGLKYEINTINTINLENKNKLNLLKSKQDNKSNLYKSELSELNIKLTVLLEEKSMLTEKLELCSLGTEMLKDTGLKAKIVRQYIPSINASINKYLDLMGANYSFVLDEHFNETIKQRHKDLYSYGSFSNGERSRINVAILLMWIDLAKSKNTVSSNLLLIDEVLDSALDDDGIGYVMGILEKMDDMNIFVISHRKEIRHLFDGNISVQKLGNFSKYQFNED